MTQAFKDIRDYIEFVKRTMKTDAYNDIFRKEFERAREWKLTQETPIAEAVTKLNDEEDKLVRSKVIARKILVRKGYGDGDMEKLLQLDNFGCIVTMSKEAINAYLKE